MKKVLVFSVGLAVMILTASNALAVPDSTANGRGYVPGQVLVKFEDRTPQGVVDEQIRRNGARVVDEVRALDVLVLGVPQA